MTVTDTAESWLIDGSLNTIGRTSSSRFLSFIKLSIGSIFVGKTHFKDNLTTLGDVLMGPAHPTRIGKDFFSLVSAPNMKALYTPGEKHKSYFVQFGAELDRKVIGTFETDFVPYFHAVSATPSSIVAHWGPFYLDLAAIPLQPWLIEGGIKWNHTLASTFFTITDRKSGKVRVVTFPGLCFSFHPVNAFDTDKEIVVDYVMYPDDSARDIFKYFLVSEVKRGQASVRQDAVLRRFRFAKETDTLTYHDFDFANGLEFPRINDDFSGKEYCFFYALGTFQSMKKIDLCTGKVVVWNPPTQSGFIAEPIFTPNPKAKSEGRLLFFPCHVFRAPLPLIVSPLRRWRSGDDLL